MQRKIKDWQVRPPSSDIVLYIFCVGDNLFIYFLDSCAFPWVLLPPCKSEPPPLRRSEIEFSVRWSRRCQPTHGFTPLRLIFRRSRALFGGGRVIFPFSRLPLAPICSHSLPFGCFIPLSYLPVSVSPLPPTLCFICLPSPKMWLSRKLSRFDVHNIIFCYSTVWHG